MFIYPAASAISKGVRPEVEVIVGSALLSKRNPRLQSFLVVQPSKEVYQVLPTSTAFMNVDHFRT